MSGTSADGIDAALVLVRGFGPTTRWTLESFHTFPYSEDIRRRVLDAVDARAPEIARLDVELGERFAHAVLGLVRRAGRRPDEIDCIGTHGQTICHIAPPLPGPRATLQIAEPAVIAERTGIPVVCDFRPRDIAAGGSGAPLVPAADAILFRDAVHPLAILNIGGIANLTLIPRRDADPEGFDTGPGNAVIDGLARRLPGAPPCDRDGAMALRGRVRGDRVEAWLRDAYFQAPPPKSTGPEVFGTPFVERILREMPDAPPEDRIATATAFVARSIADAFRRFVPRSGWPEEMWIAGGGARNPALAGALREAMAPIGIVPLEQRAGLDADAREAVAFAILANEFLGGRPGNAPLATGARRRAVLGMWVPGHDVA
ncbi:MAG: anhydro-N-acetylmuramic acid kinase [Planctomycetes bacterium]|nr:anhydro-N-acetylmuramic acid kinase [Planctomycetota bacterium]